MIKSQNLKVNIYLKIENSSGSAFFFNLINKKFGDEKSPFVVSKED
jgi:hypothetical protein